MQTHLGRFRDQISPIALASLLSLVAISQARSQASPPPDIADIPYATLHPRECLDLYLPTGGGPWPLVIYIHGGGWFVGDKSNVTPLVQPLLSRGMAVASINYRYSYQATYPAQIHDCKAAVRWLRAHASQYNLDPLRFGALGHSAGGHLASLLGTSGGVASLEGTVGSHLDQPSTVQAVVDCAGPIDLFAWADYHGNGFAEESMLIGHSLLDIEAHMNSPQYAGWVALVQSANPATFASAGDPPFLIMHGTADTTVPVDQSEYFHAALAGTGAWSELLLLPGIDHDVPPAEHQAAYDFLQQALAAAAGDPPDDGPALIGNAGEAFGACGAIIGDVDGDGVADFIIGAPHNSQAGLKAGAAYVFSGQDHGLLHALYGERAGDRFGSSVGGAGDVDGDGVADFIIGAPRHDGPGADAGRAYVFSGASWSILFQRDGAAAGDRFGTSVAGAGDVNGDGYADVIVGAPYSDVAGHDSGRVFIFKGPGGALEKSIAGEAPNDHFGWSVACAGRINGNGRDDVIIGAPMLASASRAGRAYIYGKSNSHWTRLRRMSGTAPAERFGYSVARLGDVNGDGRDDVIVGAPRFSGSAANSGRARVYSGLSGSLLRTIMPPVNRAGQKFGHSVAGTRDVTGDGRPEILIGAPGPASGAGAKPGCVCVYNGASFGYMQRHDGTQVGARFGVWIAGDTPPAAPGGPGGPAPAALVGADRFSQGGSRVGACHLMAP